jgi:hypothetical protein
MTHETLLQLFHYEKKMSPDIAETLTRLLQIIMPNKLTIQLACQLLIIMPNKLTIQLAYQLLIIMLKKLTNQLAHQLLIIMLKPASCKNLWIMDPIVPIQP